MIMIDPPGPFASAQKWRAFLNEMLDAHTVVNNIDDAVEVDEHIKMAKQALKKLGVEIPDDANRRQPVPQR